MTNEQADELLALQRKMLQRLNVLSCFLAEMAPDPSRRRTAREQIERMSRLGISPTEIAEILGTSRNYVNKELSVLRATKKEGGVKGD